MCELYIVLQGRACTLLHAAGIYFCKWQLHGALCLALLH
jgi:hypothetical protein